MDTITIYADGACRGNQTANNNLGAWAYVLRHKNNTKSFAQAVPNTTNNKMELTSVIEALKALKPLAYTLPVVVYSDSQYVISGITSWIHGWIAKGWKDVKNADLWQELLSQTRKFSNLQFVKVPGHADCDGNNEVDLLCNAAMDQYIAAHQGD